MKKFLILILCAICTLSVFNLTACKKNEKGVINVACPDGAPALAVYKLMKEKCELEGYKLNYNIVSGSDTISSMALNGSSDITVMPTNLAAKIYNGGADIKLLSVNVFGVLYMIGKNDIKSLTDLYDKIIVNVGRGGTPDLTFKRVLTKNNIQYVESEEKVSGKVALSYVSAASEAIAKAKTSKADYIILGEPAVTQATQAISGKVVLDLQNEWNKLYENAPLYQAGIVISKKVYSNKKLVLEIENLLKSNKEYLINDINNISSVLSKNGSALSVSFNEKTIERCNLSYLSAVEAKSNLQNYFNAVSEFSSTFIGGNLPNENFYYKDS